MKEITLSNSNLVAILSDEDYEKVNQWKWQLSGNGYAYRKHWNKEVKRYEKMYMHRFILNTPKGFDTDHINRNKLDNRRENLRQLTRSLNNFNAPESKNNTSGVKGVHWFKPAKLWRAYITINRKRIELGYSKDKEECILLRKNAEVQYGVAL